jgi:23S rRNA pseudouridine1911/1915/1917 synthase
LGEPEPSADRIEINVGRDPRFRKQYTAFPEGEDGKWAVTHYQTLEGLYYVSLIECRLETGRTHQIRIHMKHLGHPLFSDASYGGDRIMKGTIFSKYRRFVENCFEMMPRQALHAKSLGFTHPTTGKRLNFEADLPEDFSAVLEKWRRYVNSRKDL